MGQTSPREQPTKQQHGGTLPTDVVEADHDVEPYPALI